MSDTTVSLSPTQRNEFDVAMELLKMHRSMGGLSPEELPELYAKYYSLAKVLSFPDANVYELVPEEIMKKIYDR